MGIEYPNANYQKNLQLIRAAYLAGYEEAPSITSMVCNVIFDDAEAVKLTGLGAAPRMREWVDERMARVFNDRNDFTATVKRYEASVQIPTNKLQADKLGIYSLRIRQMGQFAKQHPDVLTARVLAAASTSTCYDGQNLCADAHSEGSSGSQDNDLAKTGTGSTADISTDLGTAFAAFNRFKDDRGEYMRIASGPDAMLDVACAPENLPNWLTVATATKIGDTDNIWKGRIRPWSLPEIAAGTFYVMYLGAPVKPLIAVYQNEPTELQEISAPDRDYVIQNGAAFFGCQGDYTIVPGDWRYIIKFS